MEKYFLNETPDKITIITAMYARITTNEWTGNENEEVNIYKNTKNRILKALIHKKNEKERFEKLMSLEDTKPVEISQWKKDAEENINKLQTILKHRIESKSVFYRSTVSRLCSQLHKKLSNTNVEDLTYDNPLASGIICNESELTGILKMKLENNSDLKRSSETLVKSHQSWKTQRNKIRFGNNVDYGILFDERKDIIKFARRISNTLENAWRSPHYAMMASSLEQINEGTYVVEVLAPLLTATFSELPIPLIGEIESPSSKARKKSHGNKPDFMLRVKVSDKELELVNMETGRPESDWRKQISDHNRLARGAKDAFEDFSINGWYLSIHTEVPLFESKLDQVFELMQLLLELRTAVISTARMLFYRYTTRRYKKYKSSVSGVKQTFVTIGTPKGIKKR
ncbi:9795_t:CDS:2 [Gigaspora rosea]|nr:9795_t:CDS:2 [Gigaspora rosea]